MRNIISRVWNWGHRPSPAERARAQRAELHLDLPDELLAELATHFHAAVSSCLECGHAAGCGCDCCPYPLPAFAPVLTAAGGAR